MAYLGKTPSQAVRSRYYFTATGGETSLSGADDNSNTLTFTDGNYVDVYLNGVLLVAGTDYNTTTANTIGGLTALVASDVVEVVVYDTFSVFSGNVSSDFSVGGNLTVTGSATFDTDTLYVDSVNNRVGIGNASPSVDLHAKNASGNLEIRFDSDSARNIVFADNNGTYDAQIEAQANGTLYIATRQAQPMLFAINNSEAARLDASGNLLVGKTTSTSSTEGVELKPDASSGYALAATGTSQRVALFNRLTTDGEIISLRKDGTTVGSISSTTRGGATDIFIGSGDTGIYFTQALDAVAPSNQGSDRDAAIDLGRSANRFKDLYLSGGAYLGGTGSANYLDDYEEGTFTPTYVSSGTGESITYDVQKGYYVKVGRVVFINLQIGTSSVSGGSGYIKIGGLPYDHDGTYAGARAIPIDLAYGFASTITGGSSAQVTSSQLFFYKNDNAANLWSWGTMATGAGGNRIWMGGHYFTTS